MKSGTASRSLQRAVLVLLLSSSLGAGATAQTDAWNWHTLEMSARSGFFMSGRVKMKITRESEHTSLETTTTARAFGALVALSRTQSILDPATGEAREYLSFSPKRGRHYVFNAESYTVKKLAPREGYHAPVDGWDVTSNQEFPYPRNGEQVETVFDPYGMLLNLKYLALDKPGDQAVTHVATSRGPQRYTINVSESRQRKRSFKSESTGKKRTVNTREFLLRFEPDAANASNKGLLGMRGSIEIWVEARTKTLIRVSGKVPDVPGHVVLKLSAMG
jgi:hypothetical protein